jgi:hypothetical protein
MYDLIVWQELIHSNWNHCKLYIKKRRKEKIGVNSQKLKRLKIIIKKIEESLLSFLGSSLSNIFCILKLF